MGVKGRPRTFYKRFKFIVEIDGVAVSKWTKAGPLEHETAVVEQHEGGSLIPVKEPGRVKFSDLNLERGATSDRDFFNWAKLVSDVAANSGEVGEEYKKNLDIVQQDRDGTTLCRWRVYNAWPTKFKAGDWDNDADENVMESGTLTYDYYDVIEA